MNDIFRQHTLSERMADATGATRATGSPAIGRACPRPGCGFCPSGKGTIKPYDPVTTEVRRISAANEMALDATRRGTSDVSRQYNSRGLRKAKPSYADPPIEVVRGVKT